MKFKTSTSIALKFTWYVAAILFFFGVWINITSFGKRYQEESSKTNFGIAINPDRTKIIWPQNRIRGKFNRRIDDLVSIPYEASIIEELENKKLFWKITKIDDIYLMYNYNYKEIKMNNISRLIDMQRELILTTLLTTLLGATLTFILSRNFVKSSLKDINKLVHYVKTIDIHNLHTPVPLSGPEDDEIRIIGQTLQHSLDTIKTQTDSLKDFVSYASHELKTPMSTINSIIDLADKTGKYSEITPKVKKTLSEMSNLLDTLLLITKREFQSIKKEDRDIVSLIEESAKEFWEQYKDKKIAYKSNLPASYHTSTQYDIIKIIISNLMKNAYKFTPAHGTITMNLTWNMVIIHNTGKTIAIEDQEKVWQRFWKKWATEDTGYGLGLYMVKLLTEKLWRSIKVQSEENKWTTFTITMK